MNRDQAATLLGIPSDSTDDEVRKAYIARARLLHPDRFAGSPREDVQAANDAMAQLNLAYETLKAGTSYGNESGDASVHPPVWSDPSTACGICAWGPAAPVKFNAVTGLVIFWRWRTFEAPLCHFCGIAMYNESQRATLLKGWWGIIAPLATIVAFVGNWMRARVTNRLPLPVGRYPNAPTSLPMPIVYSTPWFKRPMSLVATAAALFIIASILSAVLAPPPSRSGTGGGTTNQPAVGVGSNDLFGTCWNDSSGTSVEQVECGAGADWIATTRVSDPSECSDSYLQEGAYAFCLRPY